MRSFSLYTRWMRKIYIIFRRCLPYENGFSFLNANNKVTDCSSFLRPDRGCGSDDCIRAKVVGKCTVTDSVLLLPCRPPPPRLWWDVTRHMGVLVGDTGFMFIFAYHLFLFAWRENLWCGFIVWHLRYVSESYMHRRKKNRNTRNQVLRCVCVWSRNWLALFFIAQIYMPFWTESSPFFYCKIVNICGIS